MKRLLKFLITLLILASIIFILFKVIKIDDIIMKKLYPLKYSEYVVKYAEEYNMDKYMVYAIIKAESNFDENAKSSSNAIGLMQIMETTALETANKMDFEVTEEEQQENTIVKRKKIDLKPMSEEEAILQMNMLGHEFFVFEDADTNSNAVLYRRKDGNYGIIDMNKDFR